MLNAIVELRTVSCADAPPSPPKLMMPPPSPPPMRRAVGVDQAVLRSACCRCGWRRRRRCRRARRSPARGRASTRAALVAHGSAVEPAGIVRRAPAAQRDAAEIALAGVRSRARAIGGLGCRRCWSCARRRRRASRRCSIVQRARASAGRRPRRTTIVSAPGVVAALASAWRMLAQAVPSQHARARRRSPMTVKSPPCAAGAATAARDRRREDHPCPAHPVYRLRPSRLLPSVERKPVGRSSGKRTSVQLSGAARAR